MDFLFFLDGLILRWLDFADHACSLQTMQEPPWDVKLTWQCILTSFLGSTVRDIRSNMLTSMTSRDRNTGLTSKIDFLLLTHLQFPRKNALGRSTKSIGQPRSTKSKILSKLNRAAKPMAQIIARICTISPTCCW